MKILLINPPASGNRNFIREGRCTQKSDFWATLWPPITLAYMGAILEREGYEVRIADSAAEGLTTDETIKEVAGFRPDLVVSSSSTPSIKSDLEFISLIKKISLNIHTAIFGVHAGVFPEECLKDCAHLDFVITGEPEGVIDKLARALDEGSRVEGIPGLSYRNSNFLPVRGLLGEFINDLDSLPFPAWHLIERGKYRLPLKGWPFLLVLPSRGCPYPCTFCTTQKYYGRKARFRSVSNVVDELEHNITSFGIRHFFFWSETFTFDKRYVLELCTEIKKRKLDISWTCNSRVDFADGDVFKKMADSGCWMVSFGIESASQKVLDNAKKGTRVEDARRAVTLARNAGLSVVGHFIFGLPGEDKGSIDETIRFSRSLGLDFAQYYCAAPFPGSELYSLAMKEGWISGNDFSVFSQDEAALSLPTISRAEISEGKRRAYREFYGEPARLLRTLRYINFMNISNLSRLARQASGFFSMQKR